MDEEELNETIRRTLAESSRPPEPPLDEMWVSIVQRAFATTPVVPLRRWQVSRWRTPAIAAAALFVGVGLGWYAAPRGVSIVPAVVPQMAASQQGAPDFAAASPDTSRTAGTPREPATSVAMLAAHPLTRSQTADADDASAFRLAARLEMNGAHGAMSRYLMQTATLLASLPADRANAAADSVLAGRAGELLTQTHLLLDSPAGSDPTLHRLLEDLELVLAQVARLRETRSGSDLQLIHQTITAHDVLPRVYDATVEAGATD